MEKETALKNQSGFILFSLIALVLIGLSVGGVIFILPKIPALKSELLPGQSSQITKEDVQVEKNAPLNQAEDKPKSAFDLLKSRKPVQPTPTPSQTAFPSQTAIPSRTAAPQVLATPSPSPTPQPSTNVASSTPAPASNNGGYDIYQEDPIFKYKF